MSDALPGLIDIFPEGSDIPPHGPPRAEFYARLIVPSGPHKDKLLLACAQDTSPMGKMMGGMMNLMRLCNAICAHCKKFDPVADPSLRLKLCDRCLTTWYCGKKCQAADGEGHCACRR
jgi:hypothetical protein